MKEPCGCNGIIEISKLTLPFDTYNRILKTYEQMNSVEEKPVGFKSKRLEYYRTLVALLKL